jgi:hypothetical protein
MVSAMDIDEQRTSVHRLLEAGERRGHDSLPVDLEWDRSGFGGTMLDTWHARLRSPIYSIMFGYVTSSVGDLWMATIFPNGRGTHPDFVIRFKSRDQAIKQFEQWVKFNWHRIPEQNLGHGASATRKPK